MLKVSKTDYASVTAVEETKLSASLQGALPAGCTHYILPLYVTKQTTIEGKEYAVLQAPMISVAANGSQIIEMRPISGLNRRHVKSGFVTRKPRNEDYIPQYKKFDSTISIQNCVKDCMYKGFAATATTQKIVKPKFIENSETGKKIAIYPRAGESIDDSAILEEKAFTAEENIFVNETQIPIYEEAKTQKLDTKAIDAIYATILSNMIAEELVTEEQAASWK